MKRKLKTNFTEKDEQLNYIDSESRKNLYIDPDDDFTAEEIRKIPVKCEECGGDNPNLHVLI